MSGNSLSIISVVVAVKVNDMLVLKASVSVRYLLSDAWRLADWRPTSNKQAGIIMEEKFKWKEMWRRFKYDIVFFFFQSKFLKVNKSNHKNMDKNKKEINK